ncbi:wound-responsive family protein [Artemisia annua]|uniref:Wound-responsive family protein n=1 Tax=Artemisia annua TaxID=35608 RepID=A0A2U1LJB1_ARTAN|nr:wound-responsive family protein [Artemisia annua]
MSSRTRSLIVAGTVGLVEALKDQGFARWNYTIRTIHHHTKANLRSVTQSKKLSTPAASYGFMQRHRAIRRVIEKSYPFYGDIKEMKSCYPSGLLSMFATSEGTIGLVEELKDQGFARWNYTLRTIHHHTKNNMRSFSQSKKLSSQAAMASSKGIEQSEESLRKVMYLSCWGPN